MIMIRATRKVAHLGLEVQKGTYGYYLFIPGVYLQSGKVHDTIDECVSAAIDGERPVIIAKAKGE